MDCIVVSDCIGLMAISSEDGLRLFDILKNYLKNSQDVKLDFSGVELVASAFLNASIGKLYSCFTAVDIENYIHITGLDDAEIELLDLVCVNARAFYKT